MVDFAVGAICTATKPVSLMPRRTTASYWEEVGCTNTPPSHQAIINAWRIYRRGRKLLWAHLKDLLILTRLTFELEEEVQVASTKSKGIKILKWENIKNGDEGVASKQSFAMESFTVPRKIIKIKEGGKMVYCL